MEKDKEHRAQYQLTDLDTYVKEGKGVLFFRDEHAKYYLFHDAAGKDASKLIALEPWHDRKVIATDGDEKGRSEIEKLRKTLIEFSQRQPSSHRFDIFPEWDKLDEREKVFLEETFKTL